MHFLLALLSSIPAFYYTKILHVCIKEDYGTLSVCWIARPTLRVQIKTEICLKKTQKVASILSFKPLLILHYSLNFSLVCYTQQIFPMWVDTAIAKGDGRWKPVTYFIFRCCKTPVNEHGELHKRSCKQGEGQLLFTARKISISWNRQVNLEGSQPSPQGLSPSLGLIRSTS